jgi:hypothetical protein
VRAFGQLEPEAATDLRERRRAQRPELLRQLELEPAQRRVVRERPQQRAEELGDAGRECSAWVPALCLHGAEPRRAPLLRLKHGRLHAGQEQRDQREPTGAAPALGQHGDLGPDPRCAERRGREQDDRAPADVHPAPDLPLPVVAGAEPLSIQPYYEAVRFEDVAQRLEGLGGLWLLRAVADEDLRRGHDRLRRP